MVTGPESKNDCAGEGLHQFTGLNLNVAKQQVVHVVLKLE
jgi:hypothetical protein